MEQAPLSLYTLIIFIMKWFSFEGRATRKEWWIVTVLTVIASFVAGFLLFFSILFSLGSEPGGNVGILLTLLVFLVIFIAQYATSVRRYHDRAKSGWWILVAFIPFVGPIIQCVELGFLKSVDEGNKYGLPAQITAKDPKRVTVGDLMSNS